jgi:serine/threonine protein kinase
MRHTLLNKVFAVKQLRDSMDPQSRRQLITDLRVMKQSTCQWIVQYYGFCCTEGEMWIYMEHMMLSLDGVYKTFLEIKPEGHVIPEQVMGVIAVSVLRGLDYLYEAHRVMHRDVKPSNILVGFDGSIRVCDFGVSTFMIKSIARTHAGSERYLPPERLNPTTSKDGYRLTSDVWAYGLTLLEMACLSYPYPKHPLKRVVNIIRGEPPRIPDGLYSADFCDLTAQCLTKLEPGRPYYRKPAKNNPDSLCLLDHSFIIDHGLRLDNKEFDMVGWWQSVLHNPDEEA